MFTLNDLIDIAVKMEKNGKAIYCRAMGNAKDRALKELLQWMADEEDCHSQWFLGQKDSLSIGSADLEVMIPDVIQEMMGENTLSLDEVDFSLIHTPAQMLKTFIMFENDTILFYEFLDTFIDDPATREGLQKIIQEESAHIEKLTLMIQAIEN